MFGVRLADVSARRSSTGVQLEKDCGQPSEVRFQGFDVLLSVSVIV